MDDYDIATRVLKVVTDLETRPYKREDRRQWDVFYKNRLIGTGYSPEEADFIKERHKKRFC